MALSSTKTIDVVFDKYIEQMESQDLLVDLVSSTERDAATMERAGDTFWENLAPEAANQVGIDLTGQEQKPIQQAYPNILDLPNGALMAMNAVERRDESQWGAWARSAALRQSSALNSEIARRMMIESSIFARSSETDGYSFVSEAGTIMSERQVVCDDRYFLFNNRTKQKYAKSLSQKELVTGRVENVWAKGMIGDIDGFDTREANFLPTLSGGVDPNTTVTGDQSFRPEGGTVDPVTRIVTNIDYRRATMPVADASAYNIGDKVEIRNGGEAVTALGLDNKEDTGIAMTFTIVGKTANSITVYPKPIAKDDVSLNITEAQSANINTRILDGATVNRLNIDEKAKVNLFWEKDSVKVIKGSIAMGGFEEAGMTTLTETLKNGQKVYMMYDANSKNLENSLRIFRWSGVTILKPQSCGVLVSTL